MTLRLAIVGAGFIAKAAHIPTVSQLRDVDIVAIADPDRANAESAARACGGANIYATSKELIERETRLDGVIVATPRGTHAETCIPLIERGIPTFLEKPLESSHQAAREIIDAQGRSGSVLMIGYHNRFDPAFLAAQHLLLEQTLGNIRYLSIRSFGGAWKAGAILADELSLDDVGNVMDSPRAESRDAVEHPAEVEWVEGWIHEVNMAHALLGDPLTVEYATTAMPRLAIVDFDRGRALFEVGLISPPGFPFECQLTIHCEHGRIELAFAPPLLFRERSTLKITTREAVTFPSLDYRESFVDELVHFLRCIQHGDPPLTTAREALGDLELCLAIASRAHAETTAARAETTAAV